MNNNLCRVSIEEAYNDRPAGKYQTALVNRTNELLEGRLDPMSNDNFSCFFSADLSHQQMNWLLMVRDELRKGSYALAGRMLEHAVVDFYTGLAKQEGQDQVDSADCHQCFDEGCAACFEQEVE